MTSWNGNIFRVTGHLCGEFTGPWRQWRGALMFSLICVWINGWVNNREAGDLRRHRGHYDVNVMSQQSAAAGLLPYCHDFMVPYEAMNLAHNVVIKWKHFRVTCPLWGETTGHRWIPLTKTSHVERWCLFFEERQNKRLSKQSICWWFETPYYVTVVFCTLHSGNNIDNFRGINRTLILCPLG